MLAALVALVASNYELSLLALYEKIFEFETMIQVNYLLQKSQLQAKIRLLILKMEYLSKISHILKTSKFPIE